MGIGQGLGALTRPQRRVLGCVTVWGGRWGWVDGAVLWIWTASGISSGDNHHQVRCTFRSCWVPVCGFRLVCTACARLGMGMQWGWCGSRCRPAGPWGAPAARVCVRARAFMRVWPTCSLVLGPAWPTRHARPNALTSEGRRPACTRSGGASLWMQDPASVDRPFGRGCGGKGRKRGQRHQ